MITKQNLYQQIMFQLARKKAAEKNVTTYKPGELKFEPAGNDESLTMPSPLQIHGSGKSAGNVFGLTTAEQKAAKVTSNPEYQPKTKKQPESGILDDSMVPIASSAGRPKDVEQNLSASLKGEPTGAALAMRSILGGLFRDRKSGLGQVASHHHNQMRKAWGDLYDNFDSIKALGKDYANSPEFDKQQALSLAPVYNRMYAIRVAIDADPHSKGSAKLKGEYDYYLKAIAELSREGKNAIGKEVAMPFYPLLTGAKSETASAAIAAGADEDAEEGEAEVDTSESEESEVPAEEKKKKKRGPTERAKDIKFNAAVALNKELYVIMHKARAELFEKNGAWNTPEKREAMKSRLLDEAIASGVGSPTKVAASRFKGEWANFAKEESQKDRSRLMAYRRIEDILAAQEIGAHAITGSANPHMQNFASWYSTGANRTMASIVDLVNQSPIYKALAGKIGRIARYDLATGKEDPNGEGHRLQFDNKEQAIAAAMVASLIGPTSANEKPSNNVKIALSVLEDGIHQWHLKYQDDPERLRRGPNVVELLALAKPNRGHLQMYSEFGGQLPSKFFRGVYHQMSKAEQLKHAPIMKRLFLNQAKYDNLTSREDIRQELLKSNPGLYHNVNGKLVLIPAKPTKVNVTVDGASKKRGFAPQEMSDYLKASASIDGGEHDTAIQNLLNSASKSMPKGRFAGHEEGVSFGNAPVYKADGTPNPKSLSSRPDSAIRFMNLMKMFNDASEAVLANPNASTEERTAAAKAALLKRDDDGKTVFDHFGFTGPAITAMFGGKLDPDKARELHAQNLAEAIAHTPGDSKDAIAAMFLIGSHAHNVLNKIVPVNKDSWFTGGLDGADRAYHGVDPGDEGRIHGMVVQGPKFGPYALGLSSPAIASMAALMRGVDMPLDKYVADRVMMELHSDAIGRRFGGTPENEFQRAGFNHAVKTLGATLGNTFKGGSLDIGKLQAIAWFATQASVSALGGVNPTEQLYTGAERAFAIHKIHAFRVLQYYKDHPEKVTPAIKSMLDDYWKFASDDVVPLRVRTAKNNVAYANLSDLPYANNENIGEASQRGQEKTLANMGEDAAKVSANLVAEGRKRKLFSKGEVMSERDQRGRQSSAGSIRANSGKDPGKAVGASGRKPADGAAARGGSVSPVSPLARSASRPVQRGSASANRHAAPAVAQGANVSANAGAGSGDARRVKLSSQFMRSMLLGTSATAQKFREQLSDIAQQIGVNVKSFNGVGDGMNVSVPATAHVSSQPVDPDTAKYIGAWAGLLGNRQSVMLFHPEESGEDRLYAATLPITNMQDVRAALDKYGIKSRTIIPGKEKSHALIYDPKQIMRSAVGRMLEEHDGNATESAGRAEFLGRPTGSAGGTDPVSDAREHYRRIIADYEERRGIPNQQSAGGNGGGGGAPVSGDSAARRSPAGGNIVRGVMYKGGAFTPGAEQKAPPAEKAGSPDRFSKAKSLAERGALRSDNATPAPGISHLIDLTAKQGMSPYQRYPDANPAHLDKLQEHLGQHIAGDSRMLAALKQDKKRVVDHEAPLNPGVTQLSGTISPNDVIAEKGFLPEATRDATRVGGDRAKYSLRYPSLHPVQFGIVDSLEEGDGSAYGTPDGRLFVDPHHANAHIERNPALNRLTDKVHEPWRHIVDRIKGYTGADDVIDAIANDTHLANREKLTDLRDEFRQSFARNDSKGVVDRVKAALAGEPARIDHLLSILPQNSPHAVRSGNQIEAMAHRIASLFSDSESLHASVNKTRSFGGQQLSPVSLAREIAHLAQKSVPGIKRAVWEHAFSHGLGKTPPAYGSDVAFADVDAPWASSPITRMHAKRIHPTTISTGSQGEKPVVMPVDHGNDYFSTMLAEFFARPVRMAREHPQTARFILGIMNGALRSHQ